jgi:hypothetical protein
MALTMVVDYFVRRRADYFHRALRCTRITSEYHCRVLKMPHCPS